MQHCILLFPFPASFCVYTLHTFNMDTYIFIAVCVWSPWLLNTSGMVCNKAKTIKSSMNCKKANKRVKCLMAWFNGYLFTYGMFSTCFCTVYICVWYPTQEKMEHCLWVQEFKGQISNSQHTLSCVYTDERRSVARTYHWECLLKPS